MPKKRKYANKFNPEWLQLVKHKKWLKVVEGDEFSAWCTVWMKH